MIDLIRFASRRRLLAGEVPRWVENSPRRAYIEAVLRSAPEWVDMGALRDLQARARARSRGTGEAWHLDHIVPLSHPRVCGLTVPWNLRIVRAAPNLSKGNAWHGGAQADLFLDDEPLGTQRALYF